MNEVEKREKIEHFGLLRNYSDSKNFMFANPDLVCENIANELTNWCINLEIEKKHDLMKHVAHQCVIVRFILAIASSLKRNLCTCAEQFFTQMQNGDEINKEGFYDELKIFIQRVRQSAREMMNEEKSVRESEEKNRGVECHHQDGCCH